MSKPNDLDWDADYWDAGQVARALRVQRYSVYRYVHSGRLVPDARFAGRPVWRPATIRAYIEAMTPQGRTWHERRTGQEGDAR